MMPYMLILLPRKTGYMSPFEPDRPLNPSPDAIVCLTHRI